MARNQRTRSNSLRDYIPYTYQLNLYWKLRYRVAMQKSNPIDHLPDCSVTLLYFLYPLEFHWTDFEELSIVHRAKDHQSVTAALRH